MTTWEPLSWLVAASAVWLTVWPLMTAQRHGLSPWPWLVLPFLIGPLTGAVYLVARWRTDFGARRVVPDVASRA